MKAICDGQIRIFMEICEAINLPVNIEKMYWGTTTLVFLGLLINTVRGVVLIPVEKISKGKEQINAILDKKKLRLNQL